ncbi:4043_t:CDS:2 [Scutellospora calospora]|uniref:4043_t:CDS:1 n=1 Tax=Scutellospora calospora TaxID=85575 RepID=A0ACA9K2D8_9GLOM|nr:4043_t:CDS:2 [Scutellospora calospora]
MLHWEGNHADQKTCFTLNIVRRTEPKSKLDDDCDEADVLWFELSTEEINLSTRIPLVLDEINL